MDALQIAETRTYHNLRSRGRGYSVIPITLMDPNNDCQNGRLQCHPLFTETPCTTYIVHPSLPLVIVARVSFCLFRNKFQLNSSAALQLGGLLNQGMPFRQEKCSLWCRKFRIPIKCLLVGFTRKDYCVQKPYNCKLT